MLIEGERVNGLSLGPQRLSLQRSKVTSLDSQGSVEQREVVCLTSVFTCSDRWTNYSECLRSSTDNQVFSLSAAYSHSGGQTHISLLSPLISRLPVSLLRTPLQELSFFFLAGNRFLKRHIRTKDGFLHYYSAAVEEFCLNREATCLPCRQMFEVFCGIFHGHDKYFCCGSTFRI